MKYLVFLFVNVLTTNVLIGQITEVDLNVKREESISDIRLKGSQTSNNYAEAHKNRLQAQESEMRIFNERQKLREEYESKAVKAPELDFNSGQFVKLKAYSVQTVKIEAFIPQYWNFYTENLEKNIFVQISRSLEDGTNLNGTVYLTDKDFYGMEPLIFLNQMKEIYKARPTVDPGFYRFKDGEKRKIKFVPPTSTASLAGLQEGDSILEIDQKPISDDDLNNPDFSMISLFSEKVPGDSIEIIGKRDGKLFVTNLELQKQKGVFYSEFQVKGNPTVMFAYPDVIDSYGTYEEILTVVNFTPYKNLMIITEFQIQSNSGNTNWDFQFQRLRKSMSRFVENLIIN